MCGCKTEGGLDPQGADRRGIVVEGREENGMADRREFVVWVHRMKK